MTYRDAVLATAPVAYWRLGEAGGTLAADEMGAHDATYVNAPTLGEPGLLVGDTDTGVSFVAASSQYLTCAVPFGAAPDVSFVAWVKPSAVTLGGTANIIGSASGCPAFAFAGDTLTFAATNVAGASSGLLSFVAGTTYMVGVTYDGLTGAVTYYVNGVAVDTDILNPVNFSAGNVDGLFHYGSTVNIRHWDGEGDEVAIWDRVLTAAEIADLYVVGVDMPILSVTVDGLANGHLYVVTAGTGANVVDGSYAGPVSFHVPDGTYSIYVDVISPPTPPSGWVGGGGPYTAAPIVVAGDTSVTVAHDGTDWQVVTGLPLSTEPVNAKNYMDLNTGCIYELDETTGIYVEVYCPDTSGGGGGLPPDTSPPPVPVIRSPLTSSSDQQDDGTTVTVIAGLVGYDAPVAGTLTDLASIVVESTRFTRLDDATQPDWTLATQWIGAAADKTGTADTSIIQPAVLSAARYWWRAHAVDESGNKSDASAVVEVVTATDNDGPPQPTGFLLQAGHKSFGLVWSPILADDMAYTEVRWAVHGTTGWVNIRVGGTIAVITGLTNDTQYDVQARAVDRSGNVFTGTYTATTPPNPISAKADSDPDVGFVAAGSVTPSEIGGNDVSWTPEIMAEVFAGKINADWIRVGTLRAGNAPDLPVPPPAPTPDVQIEVYNALGLLTGTWGVNGIALTNPVDPNDPIGHPGNPNYLMRLSESGLFVYDMSVPATPVALVSVTPLGIDAASIRYGSARGGHNLVQNSSFELGAFAVVVQLAATWDVAADWNAAGSRQGADINITTGANSLAMTSIV